MIYVLVLSIGVLCGALVAGVGLHRALVTGRCGLRCGVWPGEISPVTIEGRRVFQIAAIGGQP